MKTTDSIARERAARYSATAGAVSPVDLHEGVRNPGMPLELDWIREIRVNRSAVERRAATLGTRRSVKKEWQAAWLLKAITLIDLTTLAGDDTPGRVRRLCAKARQPVRRDLLQALGMGDATSAVAELADLEALSLAGGSEEYAATRADETNFMISGRLPFVVAKPVEIL